MTAIERFLGRFVEPRDISPETFQLVVLPGLVGEHVHNQKAVVHQHPAEGVSALDPLWLRPSGLGDGLFDRIDDGPNLTVVSTRRDHEPVGDGQNAADIEGVGALSELFVSCFTCQSYPGDQFFIFNRLVFFRVLSRFGRYGVQDDSS